MLHPQPFCEHLFQPDFPLSASEDLLLKESSLSLADGPSKACSSPLRNPQLREFPRLQAITLSHSRTSFARNRWQLSRVIFPTCLPP